jgi:hypothetical protein
LVDSAGRIERFRRKYGNYLEKNKKEVKEEAKKEVKEEAKKEEKQEETAE